MKSALILTLSVLLAFVGVVARADEGHSLSARAVTPLSPMQDKWYSPAKASYANLAPGTLLDRRQVQIRTFTGNGVTQLKLSYQISYVSTAFNGSRQVNTALVMTPFAQQPGPPKLFAWLTPENSACINCAPSFAFQVGSTPPQADTYDLFFLNHALSKGWTVVLPDYLGPDSAFNVGQLAGQGTIDALRATLNFNLVTPPALKSQAKLAVMGYSGGGFGAAWTAHKITDYAPELIRQFVGVVAGGIPVRAKTTLNKINKTKYVGTAIAGIAGRANVFPELVHPYLNDAGVKMMAEARKMCLTGVTNNIQNVDAGSLFKLGSKYFDVPAVKNSTDFVGNIGKPSDPSIKVPTYIYQAIVDEIADVGDTDTYVKEQCARGANIAYYRESGDGGHIGTQLTGFALAFNWLTKRYNGEPAAKGCSTKTENTLLADPASMGEFGEAGFTTFMQMVWGMPAGILPMP